MWLIAKLIQSLPHLSIDIFRTVEIGETAIKNVHNLIHTHPISLIRRLGRTEGETDHFLDVANALETAVGLNNSLIFRFIEPIAVAASNLRHQLRIKLLIVDGRIGVNYIINKDTDETPGARLIIR